MKAVLFSLTLSLSSQFVVNASEVDCNTYLAGLQDFANSLSVETTTPKMMQDGVRKFYDTNAINTCSVVEIARFSAIYITISDYYGEASAELDALVSADFGTLNKEQRKVYTKLTGTVGALIAQDSSGNSFINTLSAAVSN